jgi:hypothetical protein
VVEDLEIFSSNGEKLLTLKKGEFHSFDPVKLEPA